MAEQSESGGATGAGSLLNIVFAILTLAGGAFWVSQKLTSDRPMAARQEGTSALGEQKFESRLWEDPFAAWQKLEPWRRRQLTNGLTELGESIVSRAAGKILVLAVMVSGQPYAEDREGRIRTRLAVGSGLGVSGYVPEEDHIGLAQSAWPDSKQLRQWMANRQARLGISFDGINRTFCLATNSDIALRVPFEWYRRRSYSGLEPAYSEVLLVWLDEDCFLDDPLSRLALLLNEVSAHCSESGDKMTWALIGPRYSDTLRLMIPKAGSDKKRAV
jgi:hypothetical protein